MAERGNEEKMAKALQFYKIVAVLLALLGVFMLVCGVIATLHIDEDTSGPPYFVGGYLVGVMAILSTLLCICVIKRAPNVNSDVKKQELGCAVRGHYNITIFMAMCCFVGTIFAALSRFAFTEEMSGINEVLADMILAGCIVGLILTIVSGCIDCTYSKYFGVVITQRRSGRTAAVSANDTRSHETGVTTHAYLFQIDNRHSVGTDSQVRNLERQNQLLQQQIELQERLNHQQQQQQQQQQYGGFSYPPPPPPVFDNGPAYPPAEPPPSYDKVNL